jgi:hypothetical protein
VVRVQSLLGPEPRPTREEGQGAKIGQPPEAPPKGQGVVCHTRCCQNKAPPGGGHEQQTSYLPLKGKVGGKACDTSIARWPQGWPPTPGLSYPCCISLSDCDDGLVVSAIVLKMPTPGAGGRTMMATGVLSPTSHGMLIFPQSTEEIRVFHEGGDVGEQGGPTSSWRQSNLQVPFVLAGQGVTRRQKSELGAT